MALTVKIDFKEGSAILSDDGANAFTCISRHRCSSQ